MVDATGRFVVLTHDHPFLHWDLMVEQGGALRTWRLHNEPDSGGPILAEPLPDHRLAYLDYEGKVSAGRGQVRRWDTGTYTQYADSPVQMICHVSGRRLLGTIEVISTNTSTGWAFHYRPHETPS